MIVAPDGALELIQREIIMSRHSPDIFMVQNKNLEQSFSNKRTNQSRIVVAWLGSCNTVLRVFLSDYHSTPQFLT